MRMSNVSWVFSSSSSSLLQFRKGIIESQESVFEASSKPVSDENNKFARIKNVQTRPPGDLYQKKICFIEATQLTQFEHVNSIQFKHECLR